MCQAAPRPWVVLGHIYIYIYMYTLLSEVQLIATACWLPTGAEVSKRELQIDASATQLVVTFGTALLCQH